MSEDHGYLLDLVATQAKEIEHLRLEFNNAILCMNDERDAFRAEVARLRAALEKVDCICEPVPPVGHANYCPLAALHPTPP